MADEHWQRDHLHRLGLVFDRQPMYFVTACTADRRPVLACEELAGRLVVCLRNAADATGWWVGRYVVMPDHVHFFCAPYVEARGLSALMKQFKGAMTAEARAAGHHGRLWQPEFFDHLLRSDESYHAKWLYVRENPVRDGLCATAEERPYQGDLSPREG